MATTPKNHPPSSTLHPRPVFLAGPTAVGKSEIALLLAEKLGGEIISVDSMQVYCGMDIGTAKPSPAIGARVPHHLIDVAEITEPFDAAKFVTLARKAVAEIQLRGRVPIFCGGTGLYFKAFLEGLGDAPPSDETLRAELEAAPLADLLRELELRDPATFARIDRKNPRRIVRAVEVIRLTGRPFSEQRAQWSEASLGAPASRRRVSHSESSQTAGGTPALPGDVSVVTSHSPRCFGFVRSAGDLHFRITARVDQMFAAGLVDETKRLLEHGLAQNKTAMQALGYRQVIEYLRGERSLKETTELVKIRTRQFAKRQMTWFRRQLSMAWIEVNPDESADETVAALVKARLQE